MKRVLLSAAAPAAFLPLLLDASVKSVALLTAAGLCVLLMRRASAAARHVVWLSAVAALLVLPVLSVALPSWRVLPAWAQVGTVVKPPVPETPRPAAVAPENRSYAPYETYLPEAPPAPPAPASPSAPTAAAATTPTPAPAPLAPTAPTPLLPLWLAGCALLLVRLLVARWSLGRTERRCSAPAPGSRLSQAFRVALQDSGVRGRVTLLVDAERTIPVVWGVLSPRLLMPAEAETWPAEQLRSVFLHELAHLRRRDPLAQFLTQLACALHWFNPLVWLAAWRLHVERERACDDIVLSRGVKPSAYAEHLLHVATQLSPARWTHACGLAMARKSSLEGRLLAVLSEKLNRRGVTRALTTAALLLAAVVAIPVAMMKAAEEKPHSSGSAVTDPSTLAPNTEAQLDWGEVVNGLRGAIVIRPAAPGAEPAIFLAVQNVSAAPVRFADTVAAEGLRKLYVSDSQGILFALTSGVPTQTDVTLQPREVAYLRLLEPVASGQKSVEPTMIEGLRKDSLQTWRAVLDVQQSPDGAWKGRLTTGETRGATAPDGPQPKNAAAQALFKAWQPHARLDGDIPGGLVRLLHEKVQEFIRNNEPDASGGPYAQKMKPLEPRFGPLRDWKPAELVALLDDIAAAHTIPLETTLEHLAQATLQPGQPLPPASAEAAWGQPLPGGLRMAYVLEPQAGAYHVGTEVKARMVLHNAGKEPVTFVTHSFQQPGHTAKLADGTALTLDSTYWTTLGRPVAYRLAPGQSCEIHTPGLGIGAADKDRDDWANVRAGSWIKCQAGNNVRFSPGAALLSRKNEQDDGDGWWLEFITQRLEREAPLPADTKEREYLLYRVVTELYGTAPSTTEGDAFAADTSPDALKNLAALLAKHPYGTQVHGPIRGGDISFQVLPPDPDAATRVRVASNPGYYTLRDDLKLSVSRRPAGQRIVNEASLIYFQQGKDNAITKVELPDAYNTWAAAVEPGIPVLWLKQKDLVRRYDFTDPAAIKETRYEGTQSAEAPIPARVLEAMKPIFNTPQAPAQQQNSQSPAAPATGTPAGASLTPAEMQERYYAAHKNRGEPLPVGIGARAVLIRRLTLDITGALPTDEERTAFENDGAPDALGKVIARLVAKAGKVPPGLLDAERETASSDKRIGADTGPRRKVDWSKFPSYDELANPFDPAEALRLAAKPKKTNEDTRRLMFLLLQAAVEKAPEVAPLLEDSAMKQHDDDYHSLALGLAVYDFALNGKKESLKFICDELAKEEPGSDAQATVAMGFLDEWETSIAAHERHFARGADGAGAESLGLFWEQRAFLFPESWGRFHAERLKASGLDGASLRGVWKSVEGPVRVELRLGDDQRWEVKWKGNTITANLTTLPQSGGKAVALIGKAHCGLVSREDETTLLLSIWNDGVTAPSYPTVNGIVLKKHDDVPATDPPQGAAAKLTPDTLLGAWRGTVNGEKLMLSFHRPPAEKDVQCDIYKGDATIGALAGFTIADDGSSAEVVQHSPGGGMKFGTLIPDETGKLKLELYGRQKGQQETMLTRDAETAASEPQQKEVRELLAMWKSAAYGSETISGLFLWTLVTEAQACAGANPNLDSSSKLLDLLDSRITERDWNQTQLIRLLNDVAAVSDEPLKACLASEKLAHRWLGTWEGKVGGRACSLWIVRRGPAVTGITMQMLYPEEADVDDLVYNANSNRVTLDLRRYNDDGKSSPFGRLESVSDTELRFIPTGTEAGGGGVILTRKTEVPPTEPAEQIARELFTHWKSTANADGSIPGTFIGQLATEVRAFGKAHAGRVHADNIVRLLPRFITSRDWTEAEAIKLLDDVANYATEPITARVAKAKLGSGPMWRTMVEFQDIPVKIEKWSEAKDGLRIGLHVVGGQWSAGGSVRVELWLHNASGKDVSFRTAGPNRQDVEVMFSAMDAEGKEHWPEINPSNLIAFIKDCTLPAGHVAMAKEFDVTFADADNDVRTALGNRFRDLKPGKYQLRCTWAVAKPNPPYPSERMELTAPDFAFTLGRAAAVATPDKEAAATPEVKPTREYAQRLFKKWQTRARTDGKIPGALIGQLADKVDQFIAQQKDTEEAKKLAALKPRLVSSHDWDPAEVVALLDDIEAIHSAPIGWSDMPIEFDRFRQIKRGAPLPEALQSAAWGHPAENGLRAAWLLEPTSDAYPLGTVLDARVLFHNAGNAPVTFRTETWHQSDPHVATDAEGREIKVSSTFFTGITPLAVYRLEPGEYGEVQGHGLAIGAGDYVDERSTGRIGAVIEATAGAEVSLSHTVDAAQGITFSRPDDPKGPAAVWKKTIADRVAEEAPLPASEADREQLIRRVTLDLTGKEPTEAEVTAFVSDTSADPLAKLSAQLQAKPHEEPWTGKLPTGVTKFRVTAADPEAEKKPRVAKGPGRYVLGDGVQLQVTQISSEGRRENKAQILFFGADPAKPAPHPPHDITLPDGLASYAILWVRGAGELKVVERGSVRTIDFRDPEQITEERAKENLAPEFKKLLPSGLLQTGALRTVKPERTHLFNATHAAIAVQSGDDVRFVLAAKGTLSSGISEWETSTPKAGWGFEGSINLVDVGKTKEAGHNVDLRSFKIRYTSENPDVLFLDDKPLPLGHPGSAGRLITLREHGDPEWTSRLLPLHTQGDLEAIGRVIDGTETAALDAPTAAAKNWEAVFREIGASDYNPGKRFDAEELKQLAKEPAKNVRRLMWLICRAAAEKDPQFRGLLTDERLKQADDRLGSLALALAAYDFQINGNESALKFILDALAEAPAGSDAQAAVPLGFIDEWTLSTAALEKHFAKTDGAGSTAKLLTWLKRECFFPEHFAAYRAQRPLPTPPRELTIPDTTAALSGAGALPKDKEATALFQKWNAVARHDGTIPGAVVGELADQISVFLKSNPTWETAPQLRELLPRLDRTRLWTGAEAIAVLDQLATLQTTPISMALEAENAATVRTGAPLDTRFAIGPWGPIHPSGLRAAYPTLSPVSEAKSGEAALNAVRAGYLVIHNTGKKAVVFQTRTWHQLAQTAKTASGEKVPAESASWLTRGVLTAFRLDPGQSVDLNTPGIALGTRANVQNPWDVGIGTWFDVKAGDIITVSTSPLPLKDWNQTEDAATWWKRHIRTRAARHLPFPADAEARRVIVHRLAMELYGTPVGDDVRDAFVAAPDASALDVLVDQLAAWRNAVAFAGELPLEPSAFKVTPAE